MFTGLPQIVLLPPHTFSLTTYERSKPADLPARLADAEIAIVTTVPLGPELLSPTVTPRLQLVVALASGTDIIDLAACRARGICVFNSPSCNVDAVAEHSVGLYFACRRNMLPSMRALLADRWPVRGTLMQTAMTHGRVAARGCRSETAVVVGYGRVGQRVAVLLRALGKTVEVVGRKNSEGSSGGSSGCSFNHRVPFDEALRRASMVVLCCPRTPETLNLLSTAEFSLMQADCILINVARGGIVDEAALLQALRDGQIGGAGVDVFAQEPAGPGTCALLRSDAVEDVNLVVTPHTAWVAADTTANYQEALLENLADFIQGTMKGTMKAERVKA